ncbi:MAG: SIR2 family NAD-dependent protein deacylase, partial [Candidatus Heimdallarchaeota archaeon]
MSDTNQETLLQAIDAVNKLLAKKEGDLSIVALTGSGISKGSGIPTFRGEDGLWKNYNVMDLATPRAFKANPNLVWEWYSWRIGLILEKEPNPSHNSLTELQQNGLLKWIITQNVDDLHERSGSEDILHVHGNIFRAWCERCRDDGIILQAAPKTPPNCSTCHHMLRPGVVWFGESLDWSTTQKSIEILTSECDVILVIGTSGLVHPVADYPFIAKSNGALVLEFNLESTPISNYADYVILGKSE